MLPHAAAPEQETEMDLQSEQSLREFINLHEEELAKEAVGKTALFCDYVAFCREHGYSRHSNLVEFCRESALRMENGRVH